MPPWLQQIEEVNPFPGFQEYPSWVAQPDGRRGVVATREAHARLFTAPWIERGVVSRSLDAQESSAKGEPAVVLLNPSFPVTIIHAPGRPTERRWHTRIGGDCDRRALVQSEDRVALGDEIHCEFFDQPRIVVRVKPVFGSGAVAYWEAEIVPRSEWNPSANAAVLPKAEESQAPVRRNPRYEAVDSALRSIAQAHPTDQGEVFATLDSRKIPLC